MPIPRITRVVDQFVLPSSAELTYELPVTPLSHIQLTLRIVNPTANADFPITSAWGNISRVTLTLRGTTLWDLTGEELFMVQNLLWPGSASFLRRSISATTSRFYLTLNIPLSRKPYSPTVGLPSLERGALLLTIRTPTVVGSPTLTITACGLEGATPTQVIRAVRMVTTVTAAGDYDVILAPAGHILGFLFRDAGSPLTADTSVIKTLKLLRNGIEHGISSINRENLYNEMLVAAPSFFSPSDHLHIENTASSYTQNAVGLSQHLTDTFLSWGGVMFDADGTLQNMLEYSSGDDIRIRGTATTTGELRVIPIELVQVA